jgi:hypothetical protein
MVALDVATGLIPLLALIGVVLVGVTWWILTHVFAGTRAGRHAAHFLDVGDAELPPEERVKNNHPGAGGYG